MQYSTLLEIKTNKLFLNNFVIFEYPTMPEFYLLPSNNPDMSPRSSMPEFYLLLSNNPDMSPRSSMPELYLLLAAKNFEPRSLMLMATLGSSFFQNLSPIPFVEVSSRFGWRSYFSIPKSNVFICISSNVIRLSPSSSMTT